MVEIAHAQMDTVYADIEPIGGSRHISPHLAKSSSGMRLRACLVCFHEGLCRLWGWLMGAGVDLSYTEALVIM